MLGLTQADLAAAAGISKTGLIAIETAASDPKASTLSAIQRALEAAGVEFTNGGQPGVRLRRGFLLDGGANGYSDLRGIEFGARDGATEIRVLVTDEALEIYDQDSRDRLGVFNRFRAKIVKAARSKYSKQKLPEGQDQLLIESSDVN